MTSTLAIANLRYEQLGELTRTLCACYGRTDDQRVDQQLRQEVFSGHRFIIANDDHAVAGFVSWRPTLEPSCQLVEICRFGLLPGYQDFGRSMVAALEDAAHSHFRPEFLGCRRIFFTPPSCYATEYAHLLRQGFLLGPHVAGHLGTDHPAVYLYKDFPQHVRT